MLQDDLREQLIKQFPAEVVELTEADGKTNYVCPTCKKIVTLGMDKCSGCSQVLAWDNIRKQSSAKGVKTAILKFEVSGDFAKGDCRKCPLSYIGKDHNENVYECPLKMRTNCKLELE